MNLKKMANYIADNIDMYQEIKVDKVDYQQAEDLNGYFYAPTVFDKLYKELGRIPTHREFIVAGMEQAAKFFCDGEKLKDGKRWFKLKSHEGLYWHGFDWADTRLQKKVLERIARSYHSVVAEETAKLSIKHLYPDLVILEDERLDKTLGTDIVAVDDINLKVIYFHVFRNSPSGESTFKRKRLGKGKLYNHEQKELKEYQRSYDYSHQPLRFDDETTKNTLMIGNVPFFTAKYIEQQVQEAYYNAHLLDSSHLLSFHNWLIRNGFDGVNGMDILLKKQKRLDKEMEMLFKGVIPEYK